MLNLGLRTGSNADKLKSFLGNPSELRGDLSSGGILRLDGNVIGNVRADEVILSETAVIEGEIDATRIIVGGKITGTLRAKELVEIRAKGRVEGIIITKNVIMASGGIFNGKMEMPARVPVTSRSVPVGASVASLEIPG